MVWAYLQIGNFLFEGAVLLDDVLHTGLGLVATVAQSGLGGRLYGA
jgi:hypothetical protein